MTSSGSGSAQGRLYVVAAPSGAGKTSLVKALMEREPRIQFSVSYTTRKPRPNEIPGRDYHFVSAERFQEMVDNHEFLEHAKVFDHCYGTGVRTVQEALSNGEQLLLEIDWQGARQVRARLPEACSIFILPPSRSALELRLKGRSTDSEEVIQRRLARRRRKTWVTGRNSTTWSSTIALTRRSRTCRPSSRAAAAHLTHDDPKWCIWPRPG